MSHSKRVCAFFCIAAALCLWLSQPAQAITASAFAAREGCRIDGDALSLLDSLGDITYLDSAFILRIAPLPADQQRALSLKLAADGHLTTAKLRRVPLAIAIPKDAGDIIPILYEQLREDYWRGWLNRHSLMASIKMKEWRDTAHRRFIKPEAAIRLIDIFFLKKEGKYKGGGYITIE